MTTSDHPLCSAKVLNSSEDAHLAEAFQAADAKARELGWHLKDHGNCYAKADQA